MNCPRCGLINPPSAQRCDCGYDFETRTIEPPSFWQEAPAREGWRPLWWLLGMAGMALLQGLIRAPWEFWIWLGAIVLSIALVCWSEWVRATRRAERQHAPVLAGQRKEELRCNEFFDRYYLAPNPEQAPDALADCIAAGTFHDPANVVWYLFVRIARDNPTLVRRYEALFRADPEGRPVLLKILQQVGDDETKCFLEACLQDTKMEPSRAELQAALQDWPQAPINPLTRPVGTAADLDMLWCEFRATGSTEPVLRIIDVLERPDRIRGKLEGWLQEVPSGGFSLLWNVRRRRLIRALWKQASILCGANCREILSPQDLDCHCTMQDMAVNRERLLKLSKLLPFSLYGDDGHILLKASAKWSLASHAQQHPAVLSLCESEAAKRTGRCRILLLEIVAFAALARQDLQTALTAHHQALTPDPEKALHQKAKAAAEWERLLGLSPDSTAPCMERPPGAQESALRCVEATQAADTYRAKRLIRNAERVEEGSGDVTWECEFARPANFRVFQTMWPQDGAYKDYDEWITVGSEHFRGPMYVPLPADPSRKVNSALLAGPYVTLLRNRKPVRFDVRVCGGSRYLFFQYRDVPAPTALRLVQLAQAAGIPFLRCDALVWADFETARLVKAVLTFKPSPKSGGNREQVHLFSCYDEPVSIVPPAFSLSGPPVRTWRTTIAQWARRMA